MKWALGLGVFFATCGADFAWARYTAAIAAKHVYSASAWSAIIVLVGAVSVLAYTESRWMVLPAALGAYAGTFLALHKEKRHGHTRK